MKKNSKKSHLFFLVLVIVFILIALIIYQKKTKELSQLSARAKEFIASQETQGNTQYSDVLQAPKETDLPQEIETNCLNLAPLSILLENVKTQSTNEDITCYLRATSFDPKLTFIITLQPVDVKTISEYSAVQYRRSDTEKYTEMLVPDQYLDDNLFVFESDSDITLFKIVDQDILIVSIIEHQLDVESLKKLLFEIYASLETNNSTLYTNT